jgi:hypothetical protein
MMDHAPPPPSEIVPVIPWEDPGQPSLNGLFETVRLLATRPGDAFRRMPITGGIGRPLFYAVAIGWLGLAVNIAWQVLFQGAWLPFLESADELAGMGAMYGLTIGSGFVLALLVPFFIIIGVFIAAAIYHLMLLIVGGATSGFEATARVVCYAQTAHLAGLIPCCGPIFGLVWTVVLYVVGLSVAHRTSQGKALLAFVLPLVLCCVLSALLLLAIGGLAGLAAIASSQ